MENQTTIVGVKANSNPGFASFRRISWGAVLAGVVIALVLQLVLSLLGIGIGASTIDPLTESKPTQGLGIGSVIWWMVSMFISLFAGGWVAGRLAGIPKTTDGLLHGVIMWALVTLISFFLLTTVVGKIIGGVSSVVGKTLSGIGQGVAAVAPEAAQMIKSELQENGVTLNSIKQEAQQLLSQTGKEELQPGALKNSAQGAAQDLKQGAGQVASSPNSTDAEMNSVIDKLFSKGENVVEEVDREAAVNVVVARTGKSRAEASRIVDGWIQNYQQAKQQIAQASQEAKQTAIEAADATADAVGKAAIYSSIGLILGAIVAAIGGGVGRPKAEDIANEWDEIERADRSNVKTRREQEFH